MMEMIKGITENDVAELYGVKVKDVVKEVRDNQDRFPNDYVLESVDDNYNPILVFSKKGSYMMSTVLKGNKATEMAMILVDTYEKVHEAMLSIKEKYS